MTFVKASQEEQKLVTEAIAVAYGYSIVSESIERYNGDSASSKVYRFTTTDQKTLLFKESFWYEANTGLHALRTVGEVSEELRRRGVPLARVHHTLTGNLVCEIGKYASVLFDFISGSPFSSMDAEYASAGAALGLLHRVGKTYLMEKPEMENLIISDIPVEKSYEESRAMYENKLRPALLSSHACSAPEVCQVVRQSIDAIDDAIEFIDHSEISNDSRVCGIVHNDFNMGNVLYGPSSEVVGLLDLDQMGVDPLTWDIGNTLASFGWSIMKKGPEGREEFEQKTARFLKAYHKENQLPIEEYVLCLAATQRWDVMRILRTLRRHHFENDRLPGLLPKIKERLIPRIRQAPDMFSFLTREWLDRLLKK